MRRVGLVNGHVSSVSSPSSASSLSTVSTSTTTAARYRHVLPPGTRTLAVAQVAGQGLAVVTGVLLARALGAAGFGACAFATAVVFVLNVWTTFGTDLVLIREIAGDRRLDRCAAAVALQWCLSGGVIVVVLLSSVLADGLLPSGSPSRAFLRPTCILAASLLPAAWTSVATAALRGLGMLRVYALVVAAMAAVPLAAVVVFIRAGDTPSRAATVLLGAQLAVAVLATACCAGPWRRRHARGRTNRRDIVAMARRCRMVGALGVLGVLHQRLALLSVAALAGPGATGLMSGASRVAEASKVGHVALAGAAYPIMSRRTATGGDPRDDEALIRRAWHVCVAMSLVVTAGLLVAGRLLVDHLYGVGFHDATRGLTVLALGIAPSTMATFRTLTLLADHRERELVRVLATSIGVLLGTGIVLVPIVGWIGACWAVVAADTVQFALLWARRSPVGALAPAVAEVAG